MIKTLAAQSGLLSVALLLVCGTSAGAQNFFTRPANEVQRRLVREIQSRIAQNVQPRLAPEIADPPARRVRPRLAPQRPPQQQHVPKLGFASYFVPGCGERVTYVRRHTEAYRIGLERGDTIVSVNGRRLTCADSWDRYLCDAYRHGGYVRLAIRDVHSGRLCYREIHFGGRGDWR